jgi:hypothetical protein
MRSTLALSVAAFAGLCVAQDTTQMNYPYTIDPNSVEESTRDYWCEQNKAQCPLICLQQPDVDSMTTTENDCDTDALTYTCVCENGVSPNITQYSQTLPYFICQQWGTNCVDNCNGDNTCQDSCRADHPCGAQDPYRGNATLSSMMSASATATQSGSRATGTDAVPTSGFGESNGDDDDDSDDPEETGSSTPASQGAGAVFMPNAGLGLVTVFGSVFIGFAVLL